MLVRKTPPLQKKLEIHIVEKRGGFVENCLEFVKGRR